MISLVEVKNFRCLRYIRQPLLPFQVLIGPNASGKTTFCEAISLLSKIVANEKIDPLVREMSDVFDDLTWDRQGGRIEIAVEALIPDEVRRKLYSDEVPVGALDTIRYEIGFEENQTTSSVEIVEERVFLKLCTKAPKVSERLFPQEANPPDTILEPKFRANRSRILSKVRNGNDNYYSELGRIQRGEGGYNPSIRLGPSRSAFANLQPAEDVFPVSTWFRDMLVNGVQSLSLNSHKLRKPSPPSKDVGFSLDGSNLPRVIARLKKNNPKRFKDWISHLQTALPDLADVKYVERQEDKFMYLKACYKGGLEVPSWLVSEGTLRMMALTIIAYTSDLHGIYLIEEPENGIHPSAMETVFQSLSSVYNSQILIATHSPVILSIASPTQVLCFKKTLSGATDIVRGDHHPNLRDWRGDPNLSVLYASGVL